MDVLGQRVPPGDLAAVTRRPAGTALVVLDFSGTLSIAAVRFAAPDRIDAELRRSGLWALGIDSPELFWERLIDPTWSEGSTTTRGYTAVLATVAAEVLHERGRSSAPEAIRRCVSAFADRYLACSTIAPQWRGFLQRLSARDDAAVVVATEHYAEATGHITAELARIGARGVPVTQHRSGSREVLVANSAELGCDKSSARYWQLIHRALAPATVSRVVVIDDFGANEAPGDPYAEGERVRRRRAAMTDVLTSVFRVPPDVYPFVVRTDASPADLADLVARAERFTMNVLSSHS
jgi:hypothetical protein